MEIDAKLTEIYLGHFQTTMVEFSWKNSYQLLSPNNFLKNTPSQIVDSVLNNILNHLRNAHEVAIPVSFFPKVLLSNLFIFTIITS